MEARAAVLDEAADENASSKLAKLQQVCRAPFFPPFLLSFLPPFSRLDSELLHTSQYSPPLFPPNPKCVGAPWHDSLLPSTTTSACCEWTGWTTLQTRTSSQRSKTCLPHRASPTSSLTSQSSAQTFSTASAASTSQTLQVCSVFLCVCVCVRTCPMTPCFMLLVQAECCDEWIVQWESI